MKRREFIFKGILASLGFNLIINSAVAAVEWVKVGVAGYKEESPQNQVKLGKKCSSCKWYKADAKVEGGGLCKQTVISKGKNVYVKGEGFCPMWRGV